LRNICVDLLPRRPPPHWRRCSSNLSELGNETSDGSPIPRDDHAQVGLGSTDDGRQLALVFALDILNCQDSSSLLMDNGTEAGFSLYNDVGNAHLSAKGWKVNDQLNWVNIVGNYDQGCFLSLGEGNSVVEAVLDEDGFLRFLFLRSRVRD
jgi:hypothetical protein